MSEIGMCLSSCILVSVLAYCPVCTSRLGLKSPAVAFKTTQALTSNLGEWGLVASQKIQKINK